MLQLSQRTFQRAMCRCLSLSTIALALKAYLCMCIGLCASYHMATRALANSSHEGDILAKRPRGHVISCLLQFESFSVESLPNERDWRFYGCQQTVSLWKEQAKCESVRHQKRPLHEQWCFPDRVWVENISSQHGLDAESPSCLVSHSQTACAWRKPSGYWD